MDALSDSRDKNSAKSASHNPASVDPTRAGWKTGGTPLPVCITVLLGAGEYFFALVGGASGLGRKRLTAPVSYAIVEGGYIVMRCIASHRVAMGPPGEWQCIGSV